MSVEITKLTKSYASGKSRVQVLDGISLSMPEKVVYSLLGPSGCGKTTLLRCIVGLEVPDSGTIKIGSRTVYSSSEGIFVPPEKRNLSMVFQTYAIWPHMTVFQNVAYPLKVKKLNRHDVQEKVKNMLALVHLAGYETRHASQLSGGQQQRVALARALIAEPDVILFDEPLSNLDAKLRDDTRKELRNFLGELNVTSIYVTHDRIEALSLSDHIAIIRDGDVVSFGEPTELYFNPESPFVAEFVGNANIFKNMEVICQINNGTVVDGDLGRIVCRPIRADIGARFKLCIRPEFMEPVCRDASPSMLESINIIRGKILSFEFTGDVYEAQLRTSNGITFSGRIPSTEDVKANAEFSFSVSTSQCVLLPMN